MMKALSIRQPWANMIASREKTIETRKWATTYRGDILIVSSLVPAIAPAGSALAIARLVDCRPMTRHDERAACCTVYDNAYAWILEDIRAVTPFRVKGQLGLFDVQFQRSECAEFELNYTSVRSIERIRFLEFD